LTKKKRTPEEEYELKKMARNFKKWLR